MSNLTTKESASSTPISAREVLTGYNDAMFKESLPGQDHIGIIAFLSDLRVRTLKMGIEIP